MTGQSFSAALHEHGYLLVNGDRRDFVILDNEGEVYSVARVTGSNVAEVHAKLADLDRENLPIVAEGKQVQLDRATVRDLVCRVIVDLRRQFADYDPAHRRRSILQCQTIGS